MYVYYVNKISNYLSIKSFYFFYIYLFLSHIFRTLVFKTNWKNVPVFLKHLNNENNIFSSLMPPAPLIYGNWGYICDGARVSNIVNILSRDHLDIMYRFTLSLEILELSMFLIYPWKTLEILQNSWQFLNIKEKIK